MPQNISPTAAMQLLRTAASLGVEYLFTNLGSDHPAFIEAFAELDEANALKPKVVICPHEMTALSAAHGYAMRTRKAQMVLVHVDVGTQNLGSSIHNAARGRVPALIVAGLSPVTVDGTRAGARTEYIHYTQDSPRQHEIGGQYMKWSYELRSPEMTESVLLRGYQLAQTEPQGPVYITGAREVWEEQTGEGSENHVHWPAARIGGVDSSVLETLHSAISASKRAVVITTYLGRNPTSVNLLVQLAERYGLGVCEVSPQYVNFPGSHPHHVGYRRNALVDEADLILLLDVDVPWIVSRTRPAADARIFHIDIDPVKQSLGFWHFPAEVSCQADTAVVLRQLLAFADNAEAPDNDNAQARRQWIADVQQRGTANIPDTSGDFITVTEFASALRELINDRTVVLSEAPTATERLVSTLRMEQPASFYTNGGSGLGWGINAALGVKMADPEAEVICVVGDGSYLFGVPSSTYWVSTTYQLPILTVILNNGGWNAPKVSSLLVHPQGRAHHADKYWIGSGQGARLAEIAAAAGDAATFAVADPKHLREVLKQAMETVRSGRSAVVDVKIAPVSAQRLS